MAVALFFFTAAVVAGVSKDGLPKDKLPSRLVPATAPSPAAEPLRVAPDWSVVENDVSASEVRAATRRVGVATHRQRHLLATDQLVESGFSPRLQLAQPAGIQSDAEMEAARAQLHADAAPGVALLDVNDLQ